MFCHCRTLIKCFNLFPRKNSSASHAVSGRASVYVLWESFGEYMLHRAGDDCGGVLWA